MLLFWGVDNLITLESGVFPVENHLFLFWIREGPINANGFLKYKVCVSI